MGISSAAIVWLAAKGFRTIGSTISAMQNIPS